MFKAIALCAVAYGVWRLAPMVRRVLAIVTRSVDRPASGAEGVVRIGVLGAANIAPVALIWPAAHTAGEQSAGAGSHVCWRMPQ